MSNKYFREWEKNYSFDSRKSESQYVLKKRENDNSRMDRVMDKVMDRTLDRALNRALDRALDRTLDKIETKKKAAMIFNQQTPIYSNIGFINIPYSQPVYLSQLTQLNHQNDQSSTKYVIINGCVVICQNK